MDFHYDNPRDSIDRDNERAEREREDEKVKEIVQGEETGASELVTKLPDDLSDELDSTPGEDMVGDENEAQVTE